MNTFIESGYVFDEEAKLWHRPEYHGIAYSDGDEVEGRLAEVISKTTDLSVMSAELRTHCVDWPSLYHLSPERANLLRPFETDLKGDILEIGAGCGAITRYLGECGGRVVALEGTRRRASIARSRTRDLDNVLVVNEVFDSFSYPSCFDAITLIGVLEYANLFTSADNPSLSILKRIRSLLKPDGKLFLAIENQLGLKYLAGAPEDHLGIAMYGVEDRYRADQPKTFGRLELEGLLQEAGFAHSTTFAPFPDYKLPVSIITPQGFETEEFDAAAVILQSVRRDPQLPSELGFSPELTWPVVARNRLGLDLANSFLLVAGGDLSRTSKNDVLAWHFSTNRREEFCKEAQFIKTQKGNIDVVYRRLSDRPISSTESDTVIFKLPTRDSYTQGRNFGFGLTSILSREGWRFDELTAYMNLYIDLVAKEAALRGFNVVKSNPKSTLPGALLDLTPQNIIVSTDGSLIAIDKEWSLRDTITLDFLVYRALSAHLNSLPGIGLSGDDFEGSRREFILRAMRNLGWSVTDTDIRQFFDLEARFQEFASSQIMEWATHERWLDEQLPRAASYQRSMDEFHTMSDMVAQAREQLAMNDALVCELRATTDALDAVLKSRSWKITSPLRKLNRFVSRKNITSGSTANLEESRQYIVDTSSITRPDKPVFVILPVYRDTELTLDCINRALPAIKETSGSKLLIINDCSPENDMLGALDKVQTAHSEHVQLLSNAVNLGFVRTINRGLELAAGADVVLLNSDVLLPIDWLQRLRTEAYSHPRAGTVTPLSNNTTICTFPDFLEDNPLPLNLSVDAVDDAFRGDRLPNVSAPTGVGFCMYMRSDCIEAVGILNDRDFPRGYGEENDFCQRAIAKGWLNLVTPNLFAYHKGGVSFGAEKASLIECATATIDRLYPSYHAAVRDFIQHDPLKGARITRLIRLLAQQPVSKILHVTHTLGGGTQQHVLELAEYHLTEKTAYSLILTPGDSQDDVVLKFGISSNSDSLSFSIPNELEYLVKILVAIGINIVHYHHLFGLNDNIIGIERDIGAKHYFTSHDYYMLGGNPTLTDEEGRHDIRDPYSSHNPLYPMLSEQELAQFRKRNFAFLKGADKVIFPSFATKALFDGIFRLRSKMQLW